VPVAKTTRRVGLPRALSKLGYCSRSHAVELIRAGRVFVNATVQRSAEAKVHLDRDCLEVDGLRVEASVPVYLVMNKPRGLITSASDEKGRDTIYSLLPTPATSWFSPVGRLDKASEGLLLLTNDSEWGDRLASPQSHLDKTYHVQIDQIASADAIKAMVHGVRQGGELLRAKRASLLRAGTKNCWLEVVLDEGRNRHIRRILSALNINVLRLVRVAIGPFQLGELAKGATRSLSQEEKRALDRAVQRSIAGKTSQPRKAFA
jgi:23S rRNA pseudouridine2605 synthase